VRLINQPVKVAWVDGELLLEAHPPVDAQGQSFEPDIEQFAEMLRTAVGDTTVAIHWDYAREVLQKADGVIATVALAADDPNRPEPASASPAEPGSASPTPEPASASPATEPAPAAPLPENPPKPPEIPAKPPENAANNAARLDPAGR